MTSLIFTFNGIGTISAVIISSLIVNPDNQEPQVKSMKGHIEYTYFGPEVAQRLPTMFYSFVYGELVILAFALFVVWVPPYELEKEDEIKLPINVE